MVVDFKQEEIQEEEKSSRIPFSGYISPKGELINFDVTLQGYHHQASTNPVSQMFIKYASYMRDKDNKTIYRGCPYYDDETFEEFYRRIQRDIDNLDDYIKRGFGDPYDYFEMELLNFFKNAYRDNNFFESIGRILKISDEEEMRAILQRKKEYNHPMELEMSLADYFVYDLLRLMKDICIMYLGYDSLETKKPDGSSIEINQEGEYDLDFLETPRVITTSSDNIRDKYYNYLLMDWKIDKMPRYVYNQETGLYEPEDPSVALSLMGNERMYEKEIQSIKRLVPRHERYQYFRK